MDPVRESSGTDRRTGSWVDSPWFVVAVAVAIAGLTAWRSTLGMSFMDDGYYAAGVIRLAQGARLFADEMFVQSLGFLAAVPFAKAWTSLFGMTGVVVALRLFYVAMATVGAAIVYRLLRPSFGRWPSLAGAAAPFIAPPYNLLAVDYNTMAALGMVLACVLVFAAVRDSRRTYAFAAGAAAAFASVSYPPLALVSIALLVTLHVRTRDRKLVGAMALGAAGVVAVFVAWLLVRTSAEEIGIAFRFVVGTWTRSSGPQRGTRVALDLAQLGSDLGRSWLVPLWVWFAPAAVISLWGGSRGVDASRSGRGRGIALAALPLALLIPVFANWMSLGHPWASLETIGGNYLIAFMLFAALPMFRSLRCAPSDRRDLAMMALPAGLVGFVVVTLSSAAGIELASGIVGLAPLVVAVVVWWGSEIADTLGPVSETRAVGALIVALLVLLFGSSFYDGNPVRFRRTITAGAFAGVTTSEHNVTQVAALSGLASRWVRPSTTVAVVSMPGAYLAIGGTPLTNVVWLDTGRLDDFTVAYLDRKGRWPDVVFVPLKRLSRPASEIAAAPFLSAVVNRYRLVDQSKTAKVAVFVSDGTAPAKP